MLFYEMKPKERQIKFIGSIYGLKFVTFQSLYIEGLTCKAIAVEKKGLQEVIRLK